MFIVNMKVIQGELSEKYHPEHVEFLNKNFENNVFLMFGLNKTRESTGTIIAQAESKEKLIEIFNEDLYIQHGCTTIEIEEFTPAKIANNITDFK